MKKVSLVFFAAVNVFALGKPNLSPNKYVNQKSKRNYSEGAQLNQPRSEYCGTMFIWNQGMKQLKLLDDCDITKEQLKLSDSVVRITDKTECITFIDLHVDGVVMKRWNNVGGKPLAGRAVTFDNLLHEQNRHRRANVMVTARNPNADTMDFQINFSLDAQNCNGAVEVHNEGDEDAINPDKNDEDETDSKTIILIVGVLAFGFVAITAIVVSIICWKKKMTRNVPPRRSVDENPIYGTYSRDWDGEGEYGDGDKVYVTDASPYYGNDK